MTEEVKEDKSFLEKTTEFIREEVKDFKKAGSIGGYVADKATDLVVEGAEKLGAEKLADAIENNRDVIVGTLGTVINTQVADGLTSLATSAENSNLSERIGDGIADLAVKGAQSLGAEGFAQTLNTNKETISSKTSEVVDRYTDVALSTLKRELLNQKASLPDNPVARSQNIRIQKKLDERALTSKEHTDETKPVRTTTLPNNFTPSYDRV